MDATPHTPPPTSHSHTQVTIRLPRSLLEQVDAVATEHFTCRAAIIRRMVAQALRGCATTRPTIG
jgi:metal-responsive CopG/Arc/MetJ family transcriptional regulator